MVYPGEVNVSVTLGLKNSTCSELLTSANTSCTAVITTDDKYTITLTLSNNVGLAEPVTSMFDCEFYTQLV